jgi:chromosome segregation ATPase
MEALQMSNWNDDRLDKRDQEVREGLVRLEGQIKEGFAGIDKRFAEVDKRFERVDERFERMDERFQRVDGRFAKMDERFQRVDGRFAKMDERLAQMATRQEMNQGFAEMRSAYAALTRTLLVGAIAIVAALIGVAAALQV